MQVGICSRALGALMRGCVITRWIGAAPEKSVEVHKGPELLVSILSAELLDSDIAVLGPQCWLLYAKLELGKA